MGVCALLVGPADGLFREALHKHTHVYFVGTYLLADAHFAHPLSNRKDTDLNQC